jgi:hypothetical protein
MWKVVRRHDRETARSENERSWPCFVGTVVDVGQQRLVF